MLNDEQADHMKTLGDNPDLACGCGWFFKTECAITCPHKGSQLPEQKNIRRHGDFMIRQALKLIDQAVSDQYPLKDIEEYKHSNKVRSYTRVYLASLKKKVEQLLSE